MSKIRRLLAILGVILVRNTRSTRMRSLLKLVLVIATVLLAATDVLAAGESKGPPFHPVLVPPDVLERIAVPDSTPELSPFHPANPLYGKYRNPPDLTELRRGRRSDNPYSPPPPNHGGDHDVFGTDINQVSPEPQNLGVYANMQASTTLTVPNNSTLYAPTLLPPNNARYEGYSAYNNYGAGTVRQWGVYDHRDNGFVNTVSIPKTINSTFMNTYTSGGFYSMIIQQYQASGGGDEWRVYLWNYNTGNWEHMITGAGDGDGEPNFPKGWDMYEEYLASCSGGIPEIQSKDVQVYVSSGSEWQYVTSTYGAEKKNLPRCGESNYSITWVSQYYNWKLDPLY